MSFKEAITGKEKFPPATLNDKFGLNFPNFPDGDHEISQTNIGSAILGKTANRFTAQKQISGFIAVHGLRPLTPSASVAVSFVSNDKKLLGVKVLNSNSLEIDTITCLIHDIFDRELQGTQ